MDKEEIKAILKSLDEDLVQAALCRDPEARITAIQAALQVLLYELAK